MTPSKTGYGTETKRKQGDPKDPCPPQPKPDPKPKPPKRGPRRRFDPCRTPPATPYLVIRSFAEDLGVRPVPNEDAAQLSYSPDIPLVPEMTAEGDIILQCWITNIGLGPAAPVQIEFFLLPPSITQPAPSPVLVATEHAILSPHTSKLIRSRPLTFPDPFGGGLAQGVLVRCSTPFDRHSGGLDPVEDRHVAVMNAWPITGQSPDVSLGLSNLTSRPSTARVDVAIDRLRIGPAGGSERGVEARFAGHELLAAGDSPIRLDRHLQAASALSARQQRIFRQIQRGKRPAPHSRVSVAPVSGADALTLEATVAETPRQLYPTARFIEEARRVKARHDCQLPAGRRPLVDTLRLEPFEERAVTVRLAPSQPLQSDEYIVLHLFHIDPDDQSFHGRVGLLVGPEFSRL